MQHFAYNREKSLNSAILIKANNAMVPNLKPTSCTLSGTGLPVTNSIK